MIFICNKCGCMEWIEESEVTTFCKTDDEGELEITDTEYGDMLDMSCRECFGHDYEDLNDFLEWEMGGYTKHSKEILKNLLNMKQADRIGEVGKLKMIEGLK